MELYVLNRQTPCYAKLFDLLQAEVTSRLHVVSCYKSLISFYPMRGLKTSRSEYFGMSPKHNPYLKRCKHILPSNRSKSAGSKEMINTSTINLAHETKVHKILKSFLSG